jgi:hypothetical protein
MSPLSAISFLAVHKYCGTTHKIPPAGLEAAPIYRARPWLLTSSLQEIHLRLEAKSLRLARSAIIAKARRELSNLGSIVAFDDNPFGGSRALDTDEARLDDSAPLRRLDRFGRRV